MRILRDFDVAPEDLCAPSLVHLIRVEEENLFMSQQCKSIIGVSQLTALGSIQNRTVESQNTIEFVVSHDIPFCIKEVRDVSTKSPICTFSRKGEFPESFPAMRVRVVNMDHLIIPHFKKIVGSSISIILSFLQKSSTKLLSQNLRAKRNITAFNWIQFHDSHLFYFEVKLEDRLKSLSITLHKSSSSFFVCDRNHHFLFDCN